MPQEISLKSHQYLDANNVFEKKRRPLVDRMIAVFLLPIITFAISSTISVATDNAAGLLLPIFLSAITAIPGCIFGSKYHTFRRKRKLLALCKKAGIKLTEDHMRILEKSFGEKTFYEKLNYGAYEISITYPYGNRTEFIKVEKIPNKIMNSVMREAITLKRSNVSGDILEEHFIVKDDMTDFEKSIAEQMKVTNEKFSNSKGWYWTVAKNNAITFDSKEINGELSKVENLYRDDLESRLKEHLQDS